MTTPQLKPIELAKQGNAQAIAFLINRSLKAKAITAKVIFREGYLQVMLESVQISDQAALAQFICKGITKLKIESIERLGVYGRELGEERPSWIQNFDFTQANEADDDHLLEQSIALNSIDSQVNKAKSASQVDIAPKPISSNQKDQSRETSLKKQATPQAVLIGQRYFSYVAYVAIFGLFIFGWYFLSLLSGLIQSTSTASNPASSNPPSASLITTPTPASQASSSNLSSCEKALETAAGVSNMQDTVEDLDPAIRACESMSELVSASSKFPQALDGVDAKTVASNRCIYNSSLKSTAICKSLLPAMTTIHYLAVNAEAPAPDAPVPVADQATMQALIGAAQSQDRAKYNSIVTSSSVALIPGGAIVDVVSTSGNLVQVKLRSRDIKDNDLSGQLRWTYSKFVQARPMPF